MINKVMLLGRLGSDPEVRNTQNGTAVANFSLATDETYKDRNGDKQKRTEWHRIVLWDKLAEIAEKYLGKGDLVFIEGKLQTREYEDKKDGATHKTTEIIGLSLKMVSTGNGENKNDSRDSDSRRRGEPDRGRNDRSDRDSGSRRREPGEDREPRGREVSDEDIPF